MDKFDLAGVVAATPENIYYLSGHASWSQNGYRYGGSQVYVVYPRDPAESPALLIPSGDAAYAGLDEVWLKEAYIYGRPRKAIVPDPNKLCAAEKRTLEINESEPKGPTPEKALAQLIKDKGMERGRIGMDHFAIPITQYEKIRAQQRSLKRSQVEGDLVGTVLYLASPESDSMTGQLLNVDGGFHFVG